MEHEQELTEQQQAALSQLESLRSELHSMVDARMDESIQHILRGGVLDIVPTLPLTANPSVFKGEKPESILFPDGREVKTPTWKAAAGLQRRSNDAHAPYGAARQGSGAAAHDPRGFSGKDARAAEN